MIVGAVNNGARFRAAPRRRFLAVIVHLLLGASAGAINGVLPNAVFAQVQGLWTAPLTQANGGSLQMPLTRPISRSSKLSLTVNSQWTQNYGYRPIEVTVSSPKPTTADHAITIQLHTGWNGRFNIEQDFKLPKGSTTATTAIAIPQYDLTAPYLSWDVWVDGIKDNDLSIDGWTARMKMPGGYNSSTGLSFLIVGNSNRALVAPDTMEFQALSLAMAEFPERWFDFSCFDVIAVSLKEAQLLAESRPAAFQAIRRWLRAGGQVWVTDIGREFEKISALSALFELHDAIAPATRPGEDAKDSADSDNRSYAAAWRPLRFLDGRAEGQSLTFLDVRKGTTVTVRDPDSIRRFQADSNFVQTGQQFDTTESSRRRRWPVDSSEWFVEQRVGLGTVRAFRGENEVAVFARGGRSFAFSAASGILESMGMTAEWLAVAQANAAGEGAAPRMPSALRAALQSTTGWGSRHGMTPDHASRDFPELLVPGLGLAPVTEFRVLITLFVLLIGPVNYWLLKRWGRLHLMVLTVPLAAALMTAALFGYAIVSDGFGTTIRAHSLTTLDQRTGDAACWARLSYYSGLAPGRGLTMPADVVVYPIIPGWNVSSSNAGSGAMRDVIWEEEAAKLTRGWLRSRTSTQYLTVRSRKSPHRLELVVPQGKLRATNKLGTQINYVAVIDEKNKVWEGENLAADAMAFLQPVDRAKAARRLRQLVTDNAPEPPPALSGSDSHYSIMQQRQMYRTRYGLEYGDDLMANNLANRMLADLAGQTGGEGLQLPSRSYVAVTASGPEVEFGMRGATEEASFHVIVGQW